MEVGGDVRVGETIGRSEGVAVCKREVIGVAVGIGLDSGMVHATSSKAPSATTKDQHEAPTIDLL